MLTSPAISVAASGSMGWLGEKERSEMAEPRDYLLQPVGVVRSSLLRREDAPRQGYEGAPDAWLQVERRFCDALEGIAVGSEIIVLTWLHEARRDRLKTHPQGIAENPLRGVFSTRSPDRPNPIGLHRVTVLERDAQGGLRVGPFEALDGTPIIDIKPVLEHASGQ